MQVLPRYTLAFSYLIYQSAGHDPICFYEFHRVDRGVLCKHVELLGLCQVVPAELDVRPAAAAALELVEAVEA